MPVARVLFGISTLVFAAAAGAQRGVGVDVMSGAGAVPAGSWTRESRLSGSLGVSRASGFAFLDADARETDGRTSLRQMRFEGAWESRPFGPLRFSLTAASATANGVSTAGASLDSRVNVSARIGAGGVWLGAGRSIDGDVTAGAGTWRSFGGAIISLSYQPQQALSQRSATRSRQVSGLDSTYTDTGGWHVYQSTRTRVDTTNESLMRSHPGLALRGDWAAGRWMVSAAGNRFVRADSALVSTASLTVGWRVTNALGLVASFGSASRASAREPARFAAMGVRLWSSSWNRPVTVPARPAATAFAIAPLDAGVYRITLRAPGARSAEVSGDFNDWNPLTLGEVSPGLWELTLSVTPGTHRFNVRINGDKWTAPPGVPTVDDEFNGRVGIVVVR